MDVPTAPLPDNPDDLKRLVSSLREELSASKKEIARKAQQLNKKQTHIDVLEEKLRALQRQRFGKQSEKTSGQHQLQFFNEAELLAAEQPEDAEEETVDISAHQRKKKSTRGLDPNLPRVEVVYDLNEAEKRCDCGKVLAWIADEVLEQLAVIPLQYYVIRHIRKKYACDCGQCIKTAKKKPQPIEKSQASAQLLAHIMVSKYLDGLPLYRQEKILQRHDQSLSRGKMARWLIKSAEYFQPLYNLFEDTLFSYDITLSDETGIQVLKEHNRAAESHSYLWIRRGGPPDKPVVLVDYSPSRSGETAYGLLNQCHGYLVADAYAGYNKSIARNGLKLVACNDHARRRFVEVIKNAKKLHKAKSKRQIAEQAVAYYAKLYAIEAQVKALTVEQRYRVRQEKSVPLWRRFREWLEKTHAEGVAHSGTRNAIGYMLSHWEALTRYCEDGRLPISNIQSEHVAKTIALARKNFLFADTSAGAKSSAMTYSLLETAKANKLNPYHYLTLLLNELPNAKSLAAIEKLLPWNMTAEQVRQQFDNYPRP